MTCEYCGSPFERRSPFGRAPKFCSEKCKAQTAWERRKGSDAYLAGLAARREQYVPRPPREERSCSIPTCEAKHLARGLCRLHYRRAFMYDKDERRFRGRSPLVPIGALIDGAPRIVGSRRLPNGGTFVYCPCGAMALVRNGDVTCRWCPYCDHVLVLNAEEVIRPGLSPREDASWLPTTPA